MKQKKPIISAVLLGLIILCLLYTSQQYLIYLKGLLQLDFGTSIRTGKPVLSELKRCFPATLELSIFAIIFASVVGILFGVISALKRNSVIDQIVRGVSVAGVSVPTFWLALLLLYLFYYKLGIAPGTGRILSLIHI